MYQSALGACTVHGRVIVCFFPYALRGVTFARKLKTYIYASRLADCGKDKGTIPERESTIKTIIYYFTGTGNSLAAAKGICTHLGDCDLVSNASLSGTSGEIQPGADRLGIVCPVYDFGLPSIVAEFVQRLGLSQTGYCFAVLTMGGLGVSALHQLDDLVFAHNNPGLDAAFVVRMVGNFFPLYDPAKGAKREKLLADADTRLGEIAGSIDKGLIV
jgi:hypothetical protein